VVYIAHTPFLHYCCPPDRVDHTTNLIKFARAMVLARHGCSKVNLNSFLFFLALRVLGPLIYFCKIASYKTQTCDSIALIFGISKVSSQIRFTMSLIHIQIAD